MNLPHLDLFGSCCVEEYDLYFIIYAKDKISREFRKQLKQSGYLISRGHGRELWIFNKLDKIEEYEKQLKEGKEILSPGLISLTEINYEV